MGFGESLGTVSAIAGAAATLFGSLRGLASVFGAGVPGSSGGGNPFLPEPGPAPAPSGDASSGGGNPFAPGHAAPPPANPFEVPASGPPSGSANPFAPTSPGGGAPPSAGNPFVLPEDSDDASTPPSEPPSPFADPPPRAAEPQSGEPAPSPNPFREPTGDAPSPSPFADPPAGEPPSPFADPAPTPASPFAETAPAGEPPSPFADPEPTPASPPVDASPTERPPNPFADPEPAPPSPFADPGPPSPDPEAPRHATPGGEDLPEDPFGGPLGEPVEATEAGAVSNPFDVPADFAASAIPVVAAPAARATRSDAAQDPFASPPPVPDPPSPGAGEEAIHPATGLMDRDLVPNPLELGREDATEESPPRLAPPPDASEDSEPSSAVTDSGLFESPVPPADHLDLPTSELPESRRLRGVYLSADGQWRVFTKEGVYSDAPPERPGPVDWEAHRRRGHVVATYHRDGDTATIEHRVTPRERFEVQRETYVLRIDGEPWRRTDFDLTGRTLQGRWVRDDGFVVSLDHAGHCRFGDEEGVYALGIARITFHLDGRSEAYALYSTLVPSSRHPQWLWIGGRTYRRTGDA